MSQKQSARADSRDKFSKVKRGFAFFLAGIGYNRLVFNEARKSADAFGKPLLNVGCKKVFTALSDVNLDIVPRQAPHFVQGDIQNLHMFRDKQFGAIYAAHVLEHVDDPDRALLELHRVAETVYVITPLPVYPWSWLHPQHKWILWGTKRLCRIPWAGPNRHG
jgi:SAM-dependent methyltransferase